MGNIFKQPRSQQHRIRQDLAASLVRYVVTTFCNCRLCSCCSTLCVCVWGGGGGGEACVCGRASDMNSARVQYWAVGSYTDLETRAHVHFLVTLFVNRIPRSVAGPFNWLGKLYIILHSLKFLLMCAVTNVHLLLSGITHNRLPPLRPPLHLQLSQTLHSQWSP